MITKKHYIEIANILSNVGYCEQDKSKHLNKNELIQELCIYFKGDNPLFDKDRFLNACGVLG